MKVYISKSNNGSMDAIIMAREYCRNKEYQVLEYVGGKYEPELIKSAEMIIIVPMTKIIDDKFIVGKGQWGESQTGIITKVFDVTTNTILPIKEYKVIDITNYQKTGEIMVDRLISVEPIHYQ